MKKDTQKRLRLRRYGRLNTSHFLLLGEEGGGGGELILGTLLHACIHAFIPNIVVYTVYIIDCIHSLIKKPLLEAQLRAQSMAGAGTNVHVALLNGDS